MQEQNSRIVLNRQQLRETILIDRLNQLWSQNKLIYVLLLIAMFVVAVATILYVLDNVVVPSSRYSFLERVEALRFQKTLTLRKFQNAILNLNKTSLANPAPNAQRPQHQPKQNQQQNHNHPQAFHSNRHSHQNNQKHLQKQQRRKLQQHQQEHEKEQQNNHHHHHHHQKHNHKHQHQKQGHNKRHNG